MSIQQTIFEGLPNDVFVHELLPNLSALERSALAVVSKSLNQFLTPLWPKALSEFNCTVIDERAWRKHAAEFIEKEGLSFEGTSLVENEDRAAIIRIAKFYARLESKKTGIEKRRIFAPGGNPPTWKWSEEERGVTILTIPSGLSFNSLHQEFSATMNIIVKEGFFQVLGQKKVGKAYQVIMTNCLLKKTRKFKGEKRKWIREFVKTAGCDLPKMIEAMSLAIFTKKIFSFQLFDMDFTVTYCREDAEDDDIKKMYPTFFGILATNDGKLYAGATYLTCQRYGGIGVREFHL